MNQCKSLVSVSQSRKEEAIQHLKSLRVELRKTELMLNTENILPEPGEIRALYSQLGALLMVFEGAKKKKKPVFPREAKAA